MRTENEVIKLKGIEAIEILKEIDFLLISLRNIALYYYPDGIDINDERKMLYALETTKFIDNERITEKLAKIRGLLSSKFSHVLGSDDMDDVERATEDTNYWEHP